MRSSLLCYYNFFPLNSIVVVCFLLPHHVMFSWKMCCINDWPRLHLSFEMHGQKFLLPCDEKIMLSSISKLFSWGTFRLHQWRLLAELSFSWFWRYNKGLWLMLCDVVSSERKTILYFLRKSHIPKRIDNYKQDWRDLRLEQGWTLRSLCWRTCFMGLEGESH